ncbi:MAG: Ribonuclease HII [Syntrophorhabdus sp. PtaU1.Bin058]|nr:MAG: Ribonuclease HII [Syntrophorhabdus sp. PtaU1.Bin058]
MRCLLKGLVGGIDEAGRGPLAGPVVSSCVVWKELPENKCGVADSKLLREKKREDLFSWITDHAHRVGIGIATNEEIDALNILNASLLSMERAVRCTGITPDLILVDGNHKIKNFPDSRPVVKGDRKCFYIACASIIAKVVRDRIMEMYHSLYPVYNFKQNKGYPTKDHRMFIGSHGVSPIHRRTFKGVKENLAR